MPTERRSGRGTRNGYTKEVVKAECKSGPSRVVSARALYRHYARYLGDNEGKLVGTIGKTVPEVRRSSGGPETGGRHNR